IPGGGAAAAGTIYQAMAMVNAGLCKHVLIWRAMNERSQYRFGQNPNNTSSYQSGNGTGSLLWCVPYGAMTPASWGALQAARYMHKYGLTNRDLAPMCVQQRKYAATNPKAWFYNKPITIEDHQNSKWIQEPWLRLLDCCQESDGGVAILVTSLERAKDMKQKPVHIVGATQSIPYNVEVISNYYHDDLTVMPEAKGVAKRLWEMTGLKPSDMNAAMLYDAFSPHVLLQMEAFGFVGPGEAAGFIKGGGMALDGKLPTNTHGGLAGEAYIHGMNSMAEGVRQIRGTAVNQVKKAERVLISSGMAGAVLSAV
ncbi:MAG TPA: lipid-transfer protein, partial [Nevskiaceae bacterium]|nr:lipid-transfer protein [Nevskiaceae bacterium]